MKKNSACLILVLCLCIAGLNAQAASLQEPTPKERCRVCGMFVSKYPTWLCQVHMQDGSSHFFDGVKDMLAFYFEPQKYGGNSTVDKVFVTDYYTQKWIDGTTAFYVTGSDVLGPMGHELVPFGSELAAESFKKDHHGDGIIKFEQIDLEKVNAMRSGMKMNTEGNK